MNSLTIPIETRWDSSPTTNKIIENKKLKNLMDGYYKISEEINCILPYLKDRKSESFSDITIFKENEAVSDRNSSGYYIQDFCNILWRSALIHDIAHSESLDRYIEVKMKYVPINMLMIIFLFRGTEFALTKDYSFSFNWFNNFIEKTQEKFKFKESETSNVMKQYHKSKKFYIDNRHNLIKKYKNKYIAMLDKKVIDSDENFSNLASRIYRKYGNQPFYIPFVNTIEKKYIMPSPKSL